MTRLEANRLLVKLLNDQVEKYPDIRFSQHLRNSGFISEHIDSLGCPHFWYNEFNVEPDTLVRRVIKTIKELGL